MKHIKLFEEFANNDIIVNEGAIAVLGSNMRTDIEKWLGTHAELRDWMSGFVKTSDAKKDYIKWLKSKNEIESKAQTDAAAAKQLADMGFESNTVDSPSFGKKTFFKIQFPERVMFAELFQYLHDNK